MRAFLFFILFLAIGSLQAKPKSKTKILKRGKKSRSSTQLASYTEFPWTVAPDVYQPEADCSKYGQSFSGYFAEMPVVARYGKISLEFCKQLCSHIGCTGLNYYYSFDGCELMKLPYDRKSIYIYRSDEEVSFEFSIYCIGLTSYQPGSSTSTPPASLPTSPTSATSIPVTTSSAQNDQIEDPNVCGKVSSAYLPKPKAGSFHQRIVGGVSALPHTWPWQVSMFVIYPDNQIGQCGGTLIDKQFVLTAAHCLQGVIQAVRITTGDHDVTVYEPGQQVFDSVQYRNHEDYDGDTNENDVALVKLPTPAILNNSTRLACLPNEDVPAGTMCTITGWGTLFSSGPTSDILQEANVPIVDMDVCSDKNHYLKEGIQLNKKLMTCAGYEKGQVDTCQGDSGGPLVCLKDGKWEVQGVVSFGIGCALPDFPGVYAKVVAFRDWIERTKASM